MPVYSTSVEAQQTLHACVNVNGCGNRRMHLRCAQSRMPVYWSWPKDLPGYLWLTGNQGC
jgi:hypothetical protein